MPDVCGKAKLPNFDATEVVEPVRTVLALDIVDFADPPLLTLIVEGDRVEVN